MQKNIKFVSNNLTMTTKIILPIILSGIASNTLAQTKQPNVILFLVDDMGWQDTSHPFWSETTQFNRTYNTPNMEKMAANGVTFCNAYASAVSSPSRTSLMTGMNPASHKVTNWTLLQNKTTDDTTNLNIDLPSWNFNGLQPVGSNINNSIEAVTLPQILKKYGYYTIHCGKAHWGAKDTPGANPLNLGFDVNIGGSQIGGIATYLASENFGHDKDGKPKSDFAVSGLEKYWGQNIFLSEALTIEAISAMDKALETQKPFYLYMSHYAIHVPLNKDDRYYQSYIDTGLDDSQSRYAALIEGMDKSLGDIVKYVNDKGIAENTVILFMSDNGGLSQHGRSGVKDTHNAPLNNGKGSPYEGGVRVPMIAVYPNVTKPDSRCNTVVEIADFFPTIIQIAGGKNVKIPQKIDGISFMPLLKGENNAKLEKRTLIWHYPNRWIQYGNPKGKGYGTYSSILKDGFKLIYYYDSDFCEMYNLNKDISEKTDISKNPNYTKIKHSLERELTKRLKNAEAQIPKFKNGNWCKYPDGTHVGTKK